MVSYSETPPFSLTIMGGGETGERFVFEQKEVTLGRIADNDLVLYDASVSRRHSMVYHRNGQFILEDLGSSNGTVLNGYLINQPTVLCEGDQLSIGAVRFSFSTMVFGDDSDVATEIEGWLPQTADEIPQFNNIPGVQPIAVPKGMAGQGRVPVPIEGNTQAFSAHRLQEVLQSQPVPGRGMDPASSSQFQMSASSGVPAAMAQNGSNIPRGSVPGGGSAMLDSSRQAGQVHAYVEMPTSQPRNMPSQAQMGAFPSSPSNAQIPGLQETFLEGPRIGSSPVWPAPARGGVDSAHPPRTSVPPPSTRHPSGTHLSSTSRDQLKQHPMMVAQEQQSLRKSAQVQYQQLVQLTLWSGVLFLLSSAFFLIPARVATSHPEQDKEIFLSTNTKESESIFGYNKHDRNHPHRITFQFSYRNGRMWLSYRILTGVPVDILLNGNVFQTVPPSAKQWMYYRHEFPRKLLQLNRFNLVTFKRSEKYPDNPLWGLTHLHLREQSLPTPDFDKAKISCQTGYQWYQNRETVTNLRYKAMVAFSECMDYLALMNEPPPLYKQAEGMVVRIDQELNVIYRQQFQLAQQELDPTKRKQLYERLIQYFNTDTTDPRYQRLQQLLQQQRNGSGNKNE